MSIKKRLVALLCGLVVFPLIASVDKGEKQLPKSNWYRSYTDSLAGINLDSAYQYLSAKRLKPKKQIVVGIVDSGTDTLMRDLKDAYWVNSKERAADGIDNDHNGYIDDIHGWNFLGTKDGTFNMVSAGTEEFREFKRLYPKYKEVVNPKEEDKAEYEYYLRMKKKAGIAGYLHMHQFAEIKYAGMLAMDSIMRQHLNVDTLSLAGLFSLSLPDSVWAMNAERLYSDLIKAPKDQRWHDFMKKQTANLELMRSRIKSIEHTPDKRLLMGDDMQNAADIYYGNNQLKVEGFYHGAFVASVIAGQGVVNPAFKGVYPNAKLMILRAAPDGDEYDKDVSSAIRYAVNNGAKVINVSLGKYISTSPQMVNDAIAYAASHDVLVVQAAGNDHLNIDSVAYFPTGRDVHGAWYPNFLRVGASNKTGKVAELSNYGEQNVHLFAPGVDITAAVSGDTYATEDGTSIAAPIVSGVAALLRSYFPNLRASDVKDILMSSIRPMEAGRNKSVAGGIIDVKKAILLAENYKRKK